MKQALSNVLTCLLVAGWACSACSASPTGPAVADQPPATASPPVTSSEEKPPEPDEPTGGEALVFEVGTPHLKGVVERSKLPADVKDTVTRVLDGKKVDDAAMARARKEVPKQLGDVLDGVAAGKRVEETLAGRSGSDVVRALDPDTAARWQDFSAQSEAVETNLVGFLSAFNGRDADALVKTLAFPFYTDDIPRKSAEEVKAVFVRVWKRMGERGEANVRGKRCAHMPSEAFAHAPKLGPLTIKERTRSYVKKVTQDKPGYVSVCEFAIESKDGRTLKDNEAALFVSRKAEGKYRIVAAQE